MFLQPNIRFIPKCKFDFLNIGVQEKNIISFDFDDVISDLEMETYDAIYVCGGSTQHLLNKFNEEKLPLRNYLDNGGIYIGVSAGSIILAQNLHDNLGYINCHLHVHKDEGTQCGLIDTSICPNINLTDQQAILILGNVFSIIE